MQGTNDRCLTVRDARVSAGKLDRRDVGTPVAGGLRTKASDNSVLIEFAKDEVFSEDTALAVSPRSRARLFAFDIQSVKKDGLPQSMERCHRLTHRQHGLR
jgi:hypothetical protein